MSLLLKFDSVRGVENGVREVRKSVAKKAVALQEKLDSVAQTFEDDRHRELVVNETMNEDSMKEFDDDVSNVENHVIDEGSMKECGGGGGVRKSVKKIVSIKNQVNEIEKRLENDVLFVNLLLYDAKERLRVNETLMSLLLKFDSVRGVENGVREVRKSVAKKAVALQEKLDSIAQTFEDDVISDEKTEFCDVINSVRKGVKEDDISRNDQNSASVEDQELVVNETMNEDSMKEFDDDVSNVENHVIDEGSMKECGGGGGLW
ncbi:IQ motif, EF-hand binding site, BAG domain protein [Tanacetum coccineum]